MKFAMMMYMFSMIALFSHFFIQRYIKGDSHGNAKITITNFTESSEKSNTIGDDLKIKKEIWTDQE